MTTPIRLRLNRAKGNRAPCHADVLLDVANEGSL